MLSGPPELTGKGTQSSYTECSLTGGQYPHPPTHHTHTSKVFLLQKQEVAFHCRSRTACDVYSLLSALSPVSMEGS